MPDDAIYLRLVSEWRVQELLGRDPSRVLGDCPPWLPCSTPESTPDPDRAPTIRTFASEEFETDVYAPLYIIGDNFVPGVTSVHIVGPTVDELPVIDAINRLRILVKRAYPAGTYQVTATNGTHVGNAATVAIH